MNQYYLYENSRKNYCRVEEANHKEFDNASDLPLNKNIKGNKNLGAVLDN
jgi:hypothetical protein